MAQIDKDFDKSKRFFYVDLPAYLEQEFIIELENDEELLEKALFCLPKDISTLDFYFFSYNLKEIKH